jgi:2-methylisocitrate lyase-like PEP mutase family enzyme
MASQAEKAVRFRELHQRDEAFVIPNPWDVGSARLLEGMGFEALATTSAGFAYSLGKVDGGVSRDEKMAHCRAICAAVSVPVSADLENCFSDTPDGVAETVRMAAETGLVGCSIEDYTDKPAPTIYDFDLAVARVKAGVDVARAVDFPFTISARAENVLRGQYDLAEAIRRLKAFEDVGADVLYAPGLTELDQVRAVVDAVSKPVNVLARAGMRVADLSKAGVKRISLGSGNYLVAMGACLRAARQMKDEGSFAALGDAISFADVAAIMKGETQG